MVAREGFRYAALLQQRHTKYGRIRGMVVGEGGRSTGVLLYCTIWYSHGHLAVLLQDHIICKIYILKSVIRRRTKRDVTLNSVNGKNITVDFLVLE